MRPAGAHIRDDTIDKQRCQVARPSHDNGCDFDNGCEFAKLSQFCNRAACDTRFITGLLFASYFREHRQEDLLCDLQGVAKFKGAHAQHKKLTKNFIITSEITSIMII